MLVRLNNHGVGAAGLWIGATSIIASVVAFFRLLSDPTYIDALFIAVMHAHAHALTAADELTYARLVGVTVAIAGAVVVSLLMTYFGMPKSIPETKP